MPAKKCVLATVGADRWGSGGANRYASIKPGGPDATDTLGAKRDSIRTAIPWSEGGAMLLSEEHTV